MNYIKKSLFKVKCKEKYFLQIAYTINVAIISVLIMIATGISNVVNDSLNANDLQQIQNILSSVIFISILTIVFFQWVVSMQFRALYDNRKQFNDNIRLLGISPKILFNIYITEMISMQPIALSIGIILGEFIYYILSSVLENDNRFIGVFQIVFTICLHMVVVLCCVLLTYKKVSSKDVITALRTNDDRGSKYRISPIKFMIGVIIFLMSIFIDFKLQRSDPLPLLLVVVSIFVLFKPIIYLVHKMLLLIAKMTRKGVFIFSELISLGYLRKSSTICKLIFFGVTLFLGLQMLYINVRMCAANAVEENVKYQSTAWKEDGYFDDTTLTNDMLLGLRYRIKTHGTTWYINGVEEDFFGYWENINISELDDQYEEDLASHFNDDDWNGIILPADYISIEDIGSEISAQIEGRTIIFKIVGSYHRNNFAHYNFYASKSYIQRSLGQKNASNIIYVKNNVQLLDKYADDSTIETYDDIKKESYEQSVKGTTLIEMMTIMIIVCALLAYINLIMLSSKNDILDIAKLSGIGTKSQKVYSIYISETIIPILISILVAIPTSIIFSRAACLAVLDSFYYKGDYIITYDLMFVITIIIIGVATFARIISIYGSTLNKRYVPILRDIKN